MKTKPKKPTIAAIVREYGISRQSVSAWVKEGLDLADKGAVATRVAQARGRETGREDYQQARLRKISAEADRQQIAAKREAGELVLAANIFAEGEAAGRAFQNGLNRLEGDLPGRLAGHTAGHIKKLLHASFRELLNELADRPSDKFLKIP
jgi:hypothetical protein